MEFEEKRRLSRLTVSVPCRFQGPRSSHDGLISNLSIEGAFIQASVVPHPGAMLKVSFETGPGSQVQAEAKVVHRGYFEETQDHQGFGVRFDRFEGDGQSLVSDFLQGRA